MEEIAVTATELSKRYRIGERRQKYRTLREALMDGITSPFRKAGSILRGQAYGAAGLEEEIWALKDVSFEIKRGEVLGVIGRNGAGKTTLLKILSRITDPTSGEADIYGRVGSLLEVGTGMHPELTGRENILLNGAVLGMKKTEIQSKFDEIVDFSGVEKFIDTPLKHYSSGMQVRLAFSVAAHLEPEILLVDEVLAVGDMSFQKKCLGKMDEVARGGRTVIFVSHQMNAIRRLCNRCMLLEAGGVSMDGAASQVISAYEASFLDRQLDEERAAEDDQAMLARWSKWEIAGAEEGKANILSSLDAVTFVFTVKVNKPFQKGRHGVTLFDSEGRIVWGTAAYDLEMAEGVYEFAYTLPSLPIRPGVYYFRVSLYSEFQLLDVWDCIPELIVDTPPLTHPRDEWSGILNTPYELVRTKLD